MWWWCANRNGASSSLLLRRRHPSELLLPVQLPSERTLLTRPIQTSTAPTHLCRHLPVPECRTLQQCRGSRFVMPLTVSKTSGTAQQRMPQALNHKRCRLVRQTPRSPTGWCPSRHRQCICRKSRGTAHGSQASGPAHCLGCRNRLDRRRSWYSWQRTLKRLPTWQTARPRPQACKLPTRGTLHTFQGTVAGSAVALHAGCWDRRALDSRRCMHECYRTLVSAPT